MSQFSLGHELFIGIRLLGESQERNFLNGYLTTSSVTEDSELNLA